MGASEFDCMKATAEKFDEQLRYHQHWLDVLEDE
jgi:hypothetical protein